MSTGDALQLANEAFSRGDWLTARDAFLAAQAAGEELPAEAVYRLGECVWWLGEFRRATSLYQEAHQRYLREGRSREAAMAALGIAGLCFMRGEAAFASGWMGRGLRLLENEPPGAEHGYVLFIELSGSLQNGDLDAAIEQARELQEVGGKFGDPNLVALGIVSEGQARIKQGLYRDGMRLLDEAMLAAISDELAPEWAGNIYCQMMVACHDLGDLERARQWTQATLRWCESLPASGPFLGVCRVHRAQLFQIEGAWAEAEVEARRVCEELSDFDLGTTAEGYYQLGELKRLRGELAEAEQAYKQAHIFGRDPQPGLALLQLAQGLADEAHASLQTALTAGPQDALRRAWLCIACVEVSLAAGRPAEARAACDELRAAAATFESSVLDAAGRQALGAVLLEEGDAAEALRTLRAACLRWQQLNAPYEVARTRVLLSRAYEALGDTSAARMELEAAEQVFRSLGAEPDVRAVEARRQGPVRSTGGLTERELTVLALLSAGQSNRGIAETLVISEHTVARHLTNIYSKLGISSRTEAARFAFENGLTSANTKNLVV